MPHSFTALIEKDPESGVYIGTVPALPGAQTFGATLEELQIKLREVIDLCLQDYDAADISLLPIFAGVSQVEVIV